MKNPAALALTTIVIAAVALLDCSHQATQPSGGAVAHCEDDPLHRTSFSIVEPLELEYARNFSVEYTATAKIVSIVTPWRGAPDALEYELVPCGTRPGTRDFERATLEIPAQRVVTTSSTQIPPIVALGLVDRLVGHDRFDYVNSPEVRQRIDSGAMIEVGDGVRLNTEILIDLHPDLVFAYSIGNPELDILGNLRNARISFVVDAAYMESSPLARAEWIKFIALHFNKEAEAKHLFERISSRYRELVRLGTSARERPTVLAGAPFRGTWHVPGGASFQARLLADAGGNYLWSEDSSTGSIPLDFEAVYGRALHAELWLNPSDWRSLADGRRREERMADFSAFKAGSVFNNDRRLNEHGGNDYWESGSLRPDIVLADLIKILHPRLLPDHELVFYRRLP